MTILRIVFCVLACLCTAVAVPIGIFFNWWSLIPIAGAVACTIAMFMVKSASARAEEKTGVDFMNTDEENEKIRREENDRESK